MHIFKIVALIHGNIIQNLTLGLGNLALGWVKSIELSTTSSGLEDINNPEEDITGSS